MAICSGSNFSTGIVRSISKTSVLAVVGVSTYGYIQTAAESAERLQFINPEYYQALYMMKLEMMYFIIEPVFIKSKLLAVDFSDENEIINVIARMVR